MFGLICDKHTLISSSMHLRFDLFLHLMLVSTENPCSQRYDVENCNKTVKAFLAIEGYCSLIEIQNCSMDVSLCLIFKPRSVDIVASSSSSINEKPAS